MGKVVLPIVFFINLHHEMCSMIVAFMMQCHRVELLKRICELSPRCSKA